MKAKNKKITIIVLACVLVALVLLYFLVLKPLMADDETEQTPTSSYTPAVPEVGEGTYFNRLSLYPTVELKNLKSLTVNNEHGQLNFAPVLDEDTVKLSLRFTEHPTLPLDDATLVYLRVATFSAMCTSDSPIRNASAETMAGYGVTAETCRASFTITFYEGEGENRKERTETVYIGNKSLSSVESYFVGVQGRSSIYELSSTLEQGLLIEKEDFVSPFIHSLFNDTEAAYSIRQIMIGNSNTETPFIGIEATKQEFEDSVVVKHTIQFPLNANGVAADADYVAQAIENLIINFTGDKVMAIDPTEEEKLKYGVSASNTLKMIYVDTFSGTEGIGTTDLGIVLSQLQIDEDGNKCYYLLSSKMSEEDVPLIIRIPYEGYEFLEEENAVRWVATNSIDSGFTKYIYGNEQEGESGVKSISINMNAYALSNFVDTFYLSTSPHPTDSAKTVLSVTSQSGLYTFNDNLDAELAEDRNQFNNFYAVLVNSPMPTNFNFMTKEEQDAIKKEENLVLSLRIEMNDGTLLGYDYYKINSTEVMCEFFDENNPTPRIVFNTTTQQINVLATALKQLINGEKVQN